MNGRLWIVLGYLSLSHTKISTLFRLALSDTGLGRKDKESDRLT